jgi:hypothetical protein
MPLGLDDKISELKKRVIATCAERIEAARKNPKERDPEEEHGITSAAKRKRGL